MGKGAQRERELVNWFTEREDSDAFRLAASGGGTVDELPDVFATVNGDRYAIEQKYAGRGQDYTNYVKYEEQEALRIFADLWNAEPLLVFRFSDDTTWYAVEMDSELYNSELTDSGSIGGKRTMRDEYQKLEDLI